jgi:hypothetical protein
MLGADPSHTTAENYRRFARVELSDKSPLYAAFCKGVAEDPQMLEFIAGRPQRERQPNLLLAVVRLLFGLQPDYAAFRAAVLEHPEAVASELVVRRTQTNEPGRCAALLPVLAALPQPLALLEVGAAGGLCLLPDRYGYDYRGTQLGTRLGSGEVVFPCSLHGDVPVPDRLPRVAWRAGIDLAPIDVRDPDAVRWLETLVFAGEDDRLERLRGAIAVARRDPPRLVRADLLEALESVAAQAPADATLVVFHTAVIAYLSAAQSQAFADRVSALRAVWISNEGPGVIADMPLPGDEPVARAHFVIARDREPVAFCDPHGRWLQWLTGSRARR